MQQKQLHPINGGLTFVTVALLTAIANVLWNRGLGAGDLLAFGLWSIVGAVALTPILLLARLVGRRWGTVTIIAFASVAAVLYVTFWFYTVRLFLGPMMLAFSFPIFAAWLGGALVSIVGCAQGLGTRTVPAAVALWISALAIMAAFGRTSAEPPHLLVELRPDATPEQVDEVWKLLATPPTDTPDDYNPEGVRNVSRVDGNGRPRLRVTFYRGGDSTSREKLIKRVASSPFVARVQKIESDKDPE
jgi:hypothetical protein